MGKRTGGIAKKGHRRKPVSDGDVYFLPEVAKAVANHLFSHCYHLNPTVTILDACANDGVLGNAIRTMLTVWGIPREGKLTIQDIKISGKSILDDDEPANKHDYDIIVCNSPFKTAIAEPIFHHLKKLLTPKGVLFFCCTNTFFYQGRDRAVDLGIQKYYFLPRYAFAGSGRPLLDCGIGVYHNDGIVPNVTARTPVFIDVPRLKSPEKRVKIMDRI